MDPIAETEAQIFEKIQTERRRQDGKWGTSFPDRDWDRWVTILTEEVGEFAEAVLEMPYRGHVGESEVRKELVQIAAVAVSALTFGAPRGSKRGAGGDGQEVPRCPFCDEPMPVGRHVGDCPDRAEGATP